MSKTTTKAIAAAPSAEVLAQLEESYPVETVGARIQLPRLSMVSQDQTEGKGKAMKVTVEAGTFFHERQSEEEDENGKRIWKKDELGVSVEGIILFKRKQLRMYDEDTELYTSSPVYDTDDEVVPLWCDKKEVAKGTPAELKALYAYEDKEGKTKSKLEDNRILYVLMGDEVFQLNLRGSSMWAFMTYARKVTPPTVLTKFGSEFKEKGTIAWNQMTFENVRPLNAKEADNVLEQIQKIKKAISVEKSNYQVPVKSASSKVADKEFDEIESSAVKALE